MRPLPETGDCDANYRDQTATGAVVRVQEHGSETNARRTGYCRQKRPWNTLLIIMIFRTLGLQSSELSRQSPHCPVRDSWL